jgi:SAM-dependent methyltransferase
MTPTAKPPRPRGKKPTASDSGVIDSRYYRDNLAAWDERAPAHARADGYKVRNFREDAAYLSDVVRFDIPLLGDVSGLDGVHLQCHIGTDTISLARRGARMTGLDFSSESLAQARTLARESDADVDFVQSDVYASVDALGRERFDFVFTGIGALCWLPDVRRWARVVHDLLRPGGFVFIREGHPMLWAMDEAVDDDLVAGYPYFEVATPVTDEHDGSYLPVDTTFRADVSHSWNHGIGETVMALLDTGMALDLLIEHDSCPWEALPGKMAEGGDGEWRLLERPERLPLTYTLRAHRID